jgi:hypothetical protein
MEQQTTFESRPAPKTSIPGYPNLKPFQPGNQAAKGRKNFVQLIEERWPLVKVVERLQSLAEQNDSLSVALAATKEVLDRWIGPVPKQVDIETRRFTIDFSDLAQFLAAMGQQDLGSNQSPSIDISQEHKKLSNDNKAL